MTFASKDEAKQFAEKLNLTGIAIVQSTHGHRAITSPAALAQPIKTCSICNERFVEYSCSAAPINRGRCCAYCDDHVVTPMRIKLAELLR